MQANIVDDESSLPKSIVTNRVTLIRLMMGLVQGLVLYFLYSSLKAGTWPASNAYVFAPLLMIILYVPILFISGLGHIGARGMWLWILFSTLICATLGMYDIWRAGGNVHHWFGLAKSMPSPLIMVFTAIGLYIAHSLVLAGAIDKKFIARYPSYFETSWKLFIQILFAMLFVGVLWSILWIGAALFMLVKFPFLRELLQKPWFYIPVMTFAFSIGLHLTDVRSSIVRGIRSLLLVLLSWLLPITAVIVGGFLVSLPFAGLAPLWATRHATAVLLGTILMLLLLINAAFQGGELEKRLARILRIAANVACVLLLPITLIAIYSLTLRVQQYGWTIDRIIAASCLLIASCYACGYMWAALDRKTWLARIAPTNVVTAFVMLAVLLGLFSPVADPARLSVASQLSRLKTGGISAEKFDFNYLKIHGAHYGEEALLTLKNDTANKDAVVIRQRAEEALKKKNRYAHPASIPASIQARTANVTAWPRTRTLPADFLQQQWTTEKNHYRLPRCLQFENQPCDAYLLDLNGDGILEILLRDAANYAPLIAFSREADGKWKAQGSLGSFPKTCEHLWQAMAEGRYQMIAPNFKGIEIAGQRLHVQPWVSAPQNCGKP